MRLILASQSIGRKNLLQLLNIPACAGGPFEIIPSSLDEDKIVGKNPLETLKLRAKMKGEEIINRIKNYELPARNASHSDAGGRSKNVKQQLTTILSADSGAILDNKLIGKPKDYDDAVKIMKTLSGRTHELVTAVYLFHLPKLPKSPWLFIDTSSVTFRKLTDDDINIYLNKTDYTRYAGGYALFACPDCRYPTLEELTGNLEYHELLQKTCKKYDKNHSKNARPPDFIKEIKGSLSNVIGLPMEKLIPILTTNHQLTVL